jgi:hypothetical protein
LAWAAKTPALNPVNFFVRGCLMLSVYHDSKPEVTVQLPEAVGELKILSAMNETQAMAEFGGMMIGSMHKSAGGHVKCVSQ